MDDTDDRAVTSRPASQRREQTRARLLHAAHLVFAEVGMDAASVEAICERAGFTRGAFYSNFESKDELFLELITQLSDAKLDAVASRVERLQPDGPIDVSELVGRLGAPFGEGIDPQLLTEIRVQAMRDPRVAEAFLGLERRVIARIQGFLEHIMSTYGMRLRIPVADAARILVDVSNETCAVAAMRGQDPDEIADALRRRLDILVVALVTEDSAHLFR
ncbi:TetR/AcrR family transcriptional regulator [Microbacterium dextranolyticum]|uniref:TetR-family regulatory protein n=1 Tax=Microbacterium dextranolyticum TaxID=36806 RepID=A0A9W6HLL2_9MICO|nr:TetR/AcrR family transcriptional regulator [Microbacterium dextranolyticum]MBM7463932.1 AcrR family transcriptional regulator [Microbacterium dextranolyticum]GLJ95014.1 putative TetR-family regulatory protein [Microbacterium dextranolyticum]